MASVSDQEYQKALSRLADLLDRSGEQIEGEVEGETTDGENLDGFACTHGDHGYIILLTPAEEVGLIRYDYSVIGDVLKYEYADELNQLQDHSEPVPDPVLENVKEAVAVELNKLSDQHARRMQDKLIQLISNPLTSYELFKIDQHRCNGFRVENKIYPYDLDKKVRREFDIEHIERNTQAVISTSVPGKIFLQRIFGFSTREGPKSGPGLTGDDVRKDPTFQ